MFARSFATALFIALSAAADTTAPVQVMILGTFHMANPGHDLHNQKVPDVLAPEQQAQLARVAAGLAGFKPTRIDVEWPQELVAERYPRFLAGTLAPSRNEVVQLGFRLGQLTKAAVEGIDADGDFPYDAVEAWAKAHGRGEELQAMGAAVEKEVQEQSEALREGGIAGELRLVNEPGRIARGHAFYGTLPRFGGGSEQPGVDLLTAWYKRNFIICARIAQQAKPGDRIVVMFGSGHAFLLRQCVSQIPGWKLVEPAAFVPKPGS
jgi:uncharacterized protein DUF5694